MAFRTVFCRYWSWLVRRPLRPVVGGGGGLPTMGLSGVLSIDSAPGEANSADMTSVAVVTDWLEPTPESVDLQQKNKNVTRYAWSYWHHDMI